MSNGQNGTTGTKESTIDLQYIPTITTKCEVQGCSARMGWFSTPLESLNGTSERYVSSYPSILPGNNQASPNGNISRSPHSPPYQTLQSYQMGRSVPTCVSYPVKIGEKTHYISSLSDLLQQDISGGLCRSPTVGLEIAMLNG